MRKPRKREQSPRLQPEQYECQTFIRRLRQYHPEILCYHIKNESKYAIHVDEGIVKGLPDYHVPMRGINGEIGLWIEFKAESRRNHANGGCSDDQVAIMEQLRKLGHKCAVAYTWEEAIEILFNYL